MALILEYLDSMDDFAIKGIGYDTDGNNVIYKDKFVDLRESSSSDGSKEYEVALSATSREIYRIYYFSSSGKFRKYYYQKP